MDYFVKIDIFPKARDDFRLKTTAGGVLSIISITLMLILFLFEFSYYRRIVSSLIIDF